jgi:two-component system CheB/CheR fusion protein
MVDQNQDESPERVLAAAAQDEAAAEDAAESAASADADGSGKAAASVDDVDDPNFERLLEFLKDSRAFDFTGYKRPSLIRRVRHRMREIKVDTYEQYHDILEVRPEEFTALFNTILINVTGFFRDADAWSHLASDILPGLLASTDDGTVRVWSAGCASGQEAYSIAMLLHDMMGEGFRDRVKIYATDVDEDALAQARQASYTDREIAGLPDHFRDRYFDRVGQRYVVSADLRRSVIFGRNDLTRDAPISRIDILLCRNTLMYFNAETQSRVVSRLGFALRPNGVLFLGKAEMLLNHASVFNPIDLKRRFFRKALNDTGEGVYIGTAWQTSPGPLSLTEGDRLRSEIMRTTPVAQIVVGVDGRLVMVNQRASALLGLSDRDVGRPFQDLDISYRPVELRSHLAEVAEKRLPVSIREVEWHRMGGDDLYIDVQLVPLLDGTGSLLGTGISFVDVTRFRQLQIEIETANRQLETAYEELQSTNEELETTNEELQSTVEELETTNEELQSTNEELETMNEELQSSNDELQATNEQLRDRTLEITDLNAFMQSILNSLDAGVIVVNRDLVVQAWTDHAHELWGLREEETVGQHLLNLDSGLPTGELHPMLRAVINGQEASVTRRITAVNRRGRPVELRVTITPLRSDGGADVAGALVLMEQTSSQS